MVTKADVWLVCYREALAKALAGGLLADHQTAGDVIETADDFFEKAWRRVVTLQMEGG